MFLYRHIPYHVERNRKCLYRNSKAFLVVYIKKLAFDVATRKKYELVRFQKNLFLNVHSQRNISSNVIPVKLQRTSLSSAITEHQSLV